MPATKTKTETEFISLREAGRRIDTSAHVIRRLVNRGALKALRLPGCSPRINAHELAGLVARCTVAGDVRAHPAVPAA